MQGKGWGLAGQGGGDIWPGGGAVMISPVGRGAPQPPGTEATQGL